MSYIVVRRVAGPPERLMVYTGMVEGDPKTSYTLCARAPRMEKDFAETVAKQLNGMFPGHEWAVEDENHFRYRPEGSVIAEPRAKKRAEPDAVNAQDSAR